MIFILKFLYNFSMIFLIEPPLKFLFYFFYKNLLYNYTINLIKLFNLGNRNLRNRNLRNRNLRNRNLGNRNLGNGF